MRLAIGILILACASRAVAIVPTSVTFDSLDRAASGAAVRITALLYEPTGGGATRGAVIALHGCGGLYRSGGKSAGQLLERHEQMAQLLAADGYTVLLPDSFTPRGVGSVCRELPGARPVNVKMRRADALGALAWLRTHPRVDLARIALLGWSFGGSTTLQAMNGADPEVRNFRAATAAAPYFAAAIAFYPACAASARMGDGYSVAAPLQLFIGGSDDWTPAAPCVALGDALRKRGEPFVVTVYPGAFHDFDAPGLKMRVMTDITSGVNKDRGVTVGADPVARADAYAKVKAFLKQRIGT